MLVHACGSEFYDAEDIKGETKRLVVRTFRLCGVYKRVSQNPLASVGLRYLSGCLFETRCADSGVKLEPAQREDFIGHYSSGATRYGICAFEDDEVPPSHVGGRFKVSM